MSDFLERTELLIGKNALDYLATKCVAVFGLGGVGSFALEALARCGVEKAVIVDNDVINLSNVNRQLYALHSNVGKLKVDVACERLKDVNPRMSVKKYPVFFSRETVDGIDLGEVDYFVDCIDSVASKVLLVKTAKSLNKPIISCLGTGNKLDNTAFKVCDIYRTKICPLARVLRSKLKKEGVENLKVVYSEETPIAPAVNKVIPSISFVPPVAGMIIAGEVIKDMIGEINEKTRI